jgi:hypothetical protein
LVEYEYEYEEEEEEEEEEEDKETAPALAEGSGTAVEPTALHEWHPSRPNAFAPHTARLPALAPSLVETANLRTVTLRKRHR